MTNTISHTPITPTSDRRTGLPFVVLTALASLVVLLQGVWAGVFLQHDGARDAASSWIDVHARGGEVAIVIGLVALGYGIIKLRPRRDLIAGTAILLILLILESFLGGLIRDQSKDTLTAVHIPLGMAIMGLSVWLPLHARHTLNR